MKSGIVCELKTTNNTLETQTQNTLYVIPGVQVPLKAVCFNSGGIIHELRVPLKQFNRSCTSFHHSNLPKLPVLFRHEVSAYIHFPVLFRSFRYVLLFMGTIKQNQLWWTCDALLSCLVYTRSEPSHGFFLGLFLLADHFMAAGISSCSCGFDLYSLPFLLDACNAADVRIGPSSVTLNQNMWAEYLTWKVKGAASLWGLDQKKLSDAFSGVSSTVLSPYALTKWRW